MSDGNKVVVEFEAAFWSGDYGVFQLAAQREEDRGCLQTWLNLHQVLGKPILVGLLLGSAAREVESLSQEELKTQGRKPLLLLLLIGAFNSKSTQSTAGLKALKPTANGRYLMCKSLLYYFHLLCIMYVCFVLFFSQS